MSEISGEILRAQIQLTDAIGHVEDNERMVGLLRYIRVVLELARHEIEDKEVTR